MSTAAQHNAIKDFVRALPASAYGDQERLWDGLFRAFPKASEAEIGRAIKDLADEKRQEGAFYIALGDAAATLADYIETIPDGEDRHAYIEARAAAGDPAALAAKEAMFLLEGNLTAEECRP